MDTLSRKHRLRQQQQQQPQFQRTNHQMLFETTCKGKENHLLKSRQQHFSSSSEDYDVNFSVTSHNGNNNCNSNGNEEEQFRVFRLVEIGQQQQQQQQQQRVVSGKGRLQKETSEKIIHTQQQNDQQFNPNKENKPLPGDSFCSISITQQEEQKIRKQQICEVRKSSYRNVLPLNINQKNNHQYRDDNDGCDEEFQSNVYGPTSEQEDKNTSMIRRQKHHHKHYQREKQLQIQNIYEQQNVALLSNEMNGSERSTSCSTTRSTTAYSSGFASEESGDRFHRTTGNNECDSDNDDHFDVHAGFAKRCANKLRQHSRQRSRVIADLDRLMMNASRCSTSPVESYLSSCGANSSTIAHMIGDSNINNTNEFDYSTLCRDEFSSFIAIQPNSNNNRSNDNTEPSNDTLVSSVNNNNSDNNQQQHLKEKIKLTKQHQQQQLQQRNTGPVLVGIHHADSNDIYTELSIDSNQSSSDNYCDEQDDVYELQEEEIESSSSCITSSSKNDTDPSIDKEMLVINHDHYDSQLIKKIPENDDNLSQMLDIYLDRVESLLRLSRGDKSVSFEKTFGKDNEIEVSDQFKTRIEFSPISQNQAAATTKVIQELEMIEGDQEAASQSDKNLYQLERNIIDVDFKEMLLSSPQTSAVLNLNHEEEEGEESRIELAISKQRSLENSEHSLEQRGRLELLLLNRFLELDEFKFLHKSSDASNLVNSIRRHVSEFLDDYNNYQRELKAKTTFASDWHQNWLFAFKRPNELSYSSRNGGTKRAKMSDEVTKDANSTPELNLVTERSTTTTNHLDLIKYSTLLLDKFKPVKLTYVTPQSHLRDKYCFTNEITSNESIEACYEAQEERLKELHCLALESRRQTDACRILLCDFDDDDEGDNDYDYNGNYGKQKCKGSLKKKILTRKRRALLISYNSSLLIQKCSGNKFTFSSYGYLFQCNLPAAETSHLSRTMTRRIKEEILSKLKQKVELKDKQFRGYDNYNNDDDNCLAARDKVEFLVGIGKNIALINALPVIQFCIKVSGLLPIKVRWFRQASDEERDDDRDEEISSIYESQRRQPVRRRCLRIKEGLIDGARLNWPIELQANFDYEYQNEWSSWFRFKRCQDDILFEIRDANLEKDYDKRYKCVVENYCSREECNFTLTRREISSSISESKENIMNGNIKKDQNHALLRTWSQRTLHKPQPKTTRQPVTNECTQSKQLKSSSSPHNDSLSRPKSQVIENSSLEANNANLEVVESKKENDLLNKRCFTLQTVGRLSATVAAIEEDKFGSDFPYHPENLLKRLEQNKFSVPLKYKLQAQNNSLLVDKTSTMEIDTVRGVILERQQVIKENSSPTISPQIQSKNESQFSKFETHERVVECELQVDQQEQKFDEELRKEEERDNKFCADIRELPRRENNNNMKNEKSIKAEEDSKLNEDDSTNESANSFSQGNQNKENQQRVSDRIDNDCGQTPKPRLRQLANKQITLASKQQPEHQQQVSRFTELSSKSFDQIDGQQQDIRRQLNPATASALYTAGSQQPPPRQTSNSQGNVCERKQSQQQEQQQQQQQQQLLLQLQRPAIKVKPRVAAKSVKASSLSGVVDSDCIPKASVRSLISRFS